jgi:hypothetical protein
MRLISLSPFGSFRPLSFCDPSGLNGSCGNNDLNDYKGSNQRYLKFASPCHPELVSGSHRIGKNEMLNQVQHDKSWGQMLEANSQTFYVRI